VLKAAPLGRLLLDTGVLTQAQLDEVLAAQKTDRRRLGELVVERNLVPPLELAQLLSRQLSCPWISLAHVEIAPAVLELLPAEIAIEHHVVPVHVKSQHGQRTLYVATDDPTDEAALAACSTAAGVPVRPMVAVSGEVRAALTRLFGAPEPVAPPPSTAAAGAPVSRAGSATAAPTKRAPPPPLPLPPPPRKPSIAPPHVSSGAPPLDDADLIEIVEPPPREKRSPTVLVLAAPDAFLEQCKQSCAELGARVVDGGIVGAGELVTEHRPCAIVVTDDVYAFDRSGLNRLALDHDAHLVVWSEEVDGRQLLPLLAGAIDRWGRSSYEKGAIIDGRYELLRDLGETGKNCCRWEVRNVRTARRSVLAFAVRAEDEESATAIRREQRALARVAHPGAVELRDAGTTELGDPYVVLEPLEGRTLDGLVAARTRLGPDEATAIMLQLGETLAAAHGAGVVHNHLTPENVIVVKDGYGHERVKPAGWGRAVVTDAASANVRHDITALGTCAFEAMTGRRPKPSDSAETSGMPDRVAHVVARALGAGAKPFASMTELVEALLAATPRARGKTQLLEASPRRRESTASAPATLPSGAKPTPEQLNPGPDQRRAARAAYRTPVRIEVAGLGSVDGKSEDISIGGLLVVAKGALKPSTQVTLRLALPLDGRVVAEPAIVKWSRAARSDDSSNLSALGVELISPSSETVRQIERYVAFMSDSPDSRAR